MAIHLCMKVEDHYQGQMVSKRRAAVSRAVDCAGFAVAEKEQ